MGALSAVVDTYLTTDPTSLDDVTLGSRILELELVMRRLAAAKADALRVFDARDASVADGLGTASAWLAARTGNTGLKTARADVSLGRDLARLPLLADALSAGEITAAHVRIFAKASRSLAVDVVADGEATLVPMAQRFEPAAFARLVRHWHAQVDIDEFDRREQRKIDRRGFSLAQTLDDIWHGQLVLDPEGGARLHAALEARARKAGPEDTRSRDQRWA
ncbi:MAG TPA: DUF222 domain-containing protein, partial [Mycobacteriales bacterium]|nr:DUF222 domain-containing protein [Mycobacteriales bacterium]